VDRFAILPLAAVALTLMSGSADAQVIRCENLAFTPERIDCYYYRAAMAGGPMCLFCAPQIQKPVKPKKQRRVRR